MTTSFRLANTFAPRSKGNFEAMDHDMGGYTEFSHQSPLFILSEWVRNEALTWFQDGRKG